MARWGEGGCAAASPACSEGREFSHGHDLPSQPALWQVPARRYRGGGSGRLLTRLQFANRCVVAPRSCELIALSLLAAIGLGLALGRGDPIFVAVFAAACGMAIVGGMQRFP
jgi:hypothetical protein